MIDNTNNEQENKGKVPGFVIHIGFLLLVAIIVIVVVVRLNGWSHRSVKIENNSTIGEYKSESQDSVVYRTADQPVRESDGVTRAVIFGNYMVSNYGKEKSILNRLKAAYPDWEIIDLSVDNTIITRTASHGEEQEQYDNYCLFRMVEFSLNNKKTVLPDNPPFAHDNPVDKEAFLENWKNLDFSKVDKVFIMYAMMDYYYSVRRESTDPNLKEQEETTVYGSLFKTISTLKAMYPHLEVIVVSGYPEYINDSEGGYKYGYDTRFVGEGKDEKSAEYREYGTLSDYIQVEAMAAQETFATYIDNYYGSGINEDNIHTYVDQMHLTDAGIDLVSDHILEVLKQMD